MQEIKHCILRLSNIQMLLGIRKNSVWGNTIEAFEKGHLLQHVTSCEVQLQLEVVNVGRHHVTSFTGC